MKFDPPQFISNESRIKYGVGGMLEAKDTKSFTEAKLEKREVLSKLRRRSRPLHVTYENALTNVEEAIKTSSSNEILLPESKDESNISTLIDKISNEIVSNYKEGMGYMNNISGTKTFFEAINNEHKALYDKSIDKLSSKDEF